MGINIKKIDFISAHDFQGGAARIAYYIHKELKAREYDTLFYTGAKTLVFGTTIWIKTVEKSFTSFLAKVYKKINRMLGRENFSFPESRKLLDKLQQRKPQLIHAHNLQGGYFDLNLLAPISSQYPTLITLHDSWLFSGHCSYFIDCDKWLTGCGNCPDLTRTPSLKRDGTRYNWKRKNSIYNASTLYLAAPSKWLLDESKKSMLQPNVRLSRVIPNGVDTSWYYPKDKSQSKKAIGIDEDQIVLLFVVNSRMRQNAYKDYNTIDKALKELSKLIKPEQKVTFIGLGQEGETEHYGNITKTFVPFSSDINKIAGYYSASDIYLHAANADNFPNVIMEAQASGTAIIATDVGGIPEQFIPNKTGWLVPRGGAVEMAQKIAELIDNPKQLADAGKAAHQHIINNFTIKHMVDQYLDFYEACILDFNSIQNG